jgi:methyl-accepting chemotaxis protein
MAAMGLRLKILLGFLILSLMLLIAGTWSIHQMNSFGLSVQKLIDENYKSINAAKSMLEALERQDSGILLLLHGKWEKGRSIINEADQVVEENLKTAKGNVTIPGEDKLITAIESSYAHYKELWIKPIVGTKKEGDLDWYSHEVHDAFLNAKSQVNELIGINDQELYRTSSDLMNRANRAVMPGIVAMISSLVFSLIFSYFVNLFVVNPIIRITGAISDLIDRDVPYRVEVMTGDELGRLNSAIKRLSSMAKSTGCEP